MATFFFCGIGGIGMSAIALYLKKAGNTVYGSDRSFDQGKNGAMKQRLSDAGITLFPQDGSGVTEAIDTFVSSSAVESAIPDVIKAVQLGLPIQNREVLADIFHAHRGVAVGGTSGKTTVTAMIGHILSTLHMDPTMINGGIGINTYNNEAPSNLIFGGSDLCVIEADESDASIRLYESYVSVVTNVSLDHKPLHQIRPLFESFLNRTKKGIVINADCHETALLRLTHPNIVSFSANGKQGATLHTTNVQYTASGIAFLLNGEPFTLPFIGRHNLENALAAIGACLHLDIPVKESIGALQSFLGTRRRLQTLGTKAGITFIDDYAHNPEKIKAALSALQLSPGRLFVIYQPHGFGPLKLMKNDLIALLQKQLDDRTHWIMPEVYYVGGTVTKDISSADIVAPLEAAGKNAFFIADRPNIAAFILPQLRDGDRVVVMGARDDTLTDFALSLINEIKEAPCH